MAESIAAVVVTYNRKHLLVECLAALLNQTRRLDKIYVIDQASTDGTKELLHDEGLLSHSAISYWQAKVNTGGAGGFHDGVERAYRDGHSWIWIMDDDAIPVLDACEALIPFTSFPRVVAVANHKLRNDGTEAKVHIRELIDTGETRRKYRRLAFSSFVGLMVRREAIDEIGLPKAEFFIQYDDNEYCARLLTQGDIAYASDSDIHHKEADSPSIKAKCLWWSFNRMPLERYWRTYFTFRNSLWFIIHAPGVNKAQEFPRYCVAIAKEIGAVVLLDKNQLFNRLCILSRGVRDALTERFDNDYPFKMKARMRLENPRG
jgi:GT2 family glycosyltransferase